MLSTDERILEEGSPSFSRHMAYAKRFGALEVLLLTRRGKNPLHRGALSVIPTNSWRLFYIFDAIRLGRLLSKPSVITTQDPFETGIAGVLLSRYWKVSLHVQVHTDILDPHFIQRSLRNRGYVIAAKYVLHHATRIRVVSLRIKKSLARWYLASPISDIPIFIDTKRLAAISHIPHPRFHPSLLSVGRLEPEKHFTLALRALELVRAKGYDAGLTIVGSGREKEHLRSLSRKLDVDTYVDFIDWQRSLDSLYAQADLLLVTSQYEGYGMVIIEALAAGVPVLSTDVGVAREAGATITTPEDFSSALIKWIQQDHHRAVLQGYPYFSFDSYVEAFCTDISNCISS